MQVALGVQFGGPVSVQLRLECSLEDQVESKLALEGGLEGQVGPNRRQVGLKRRPRSSELDRKAVQENPKSCPKAVQEPLHSQKARTSKFDDSTALLKVFEGLGWQFEGPS